MKNHPKPRDFSLLWRLANKIPPNPSHPTPKSVASVAYTIFPQITQKTLITDTSHWLQPITEILGLLKKFTFRETHFKTEGSNFQTQFWMDCMLYLMPIISSYKNSSCV